MSKFSANFQVNSHDTDKNGNLYPSTALRYLHEAANLQFNASHPTLDELRYEEKKAFLLAFENEIDSADIVCAAGSLPKGLDSSFYIELIRIAKKHGKRIVTDASGKTLEDVIRAQPFMVKPNRYELSLLMGKEIDSIADVKEALTFLQKSGVVLPLATLGKDGAMAYIDGKFYKFSSPEVEVINTVGSGDSSVSGIAVGLSRGMSIIDSVKLGMAAGTANTQSPETGFVTKELVEKYYKEIIVDTI